MGGRVAAINKPAFEETLRTTFNGRNYSQQIWGNTDELAIKLKEVFKQAFIRGDGPQEMARAIRKEFNVARSRAETLVRTDGTAIKAQMDGVINTPFKNVTWSERIWSRQEALRGIVQKATADLVLRGKNPTLAIPQLRKEFDVSVYEAKRLAVTEGARVQMAVQKASFEQMGFEEYEYISEPGACAICRPLDGKHFKVADMQSGLNASPMHPFCRCSTAAHYTGDKKSTNDLDRLNRMDFDEFMGKDGYNILGVNLKDTKSVAGRLKLIEKALAKLERYSETAELSNEEWEKLDKEYERYTKEQSFLSKVLDKLSKRFTGKDALSKLKNRVLDLELKTATHDDIINLGKKVNKHFDISSHLGDKEKLKEIFSNFREMGGVVPKEVWAKGSSLAVKKQLTEAFSYYPKDWAEIPQNNNRQILARKYGRGFFHPSALMPSGTRFDKKYVNYKDGYFTIVGDGVRKSTPYHEIGHMVEWSNADLVRIEKEWVDSRTKNEDYVRLKDIFPGEKYEDNEVVKKDNFVSPYIGKYYDHAAEVFTMGLQGIFEPDEPYWHSTIGRKRVNKTILDDPDFLNLTIGLILKG